MECPGKRNVTSNKAIFDISSKEITISLSEYTDLIAKETVLNQIRHVVSKEACEYGTIGILTAILRIDIPEREIRSGKKEDA